MMKDKALARPSLKTCLFGIATWGFQDPRGRDEFYFIFQMEVQLIKNWMRIKI